MPENQRSAFFALTLAVLLGLFLLQPALAADPARPAAGFAAEAR